MERCGERGTEYLNRVQTCASQRLRGGRSLGDRNCSVTRRSSGGNGNRRKKLLEARANGPLFSDPRKSPAPSRSVRPGAPRTAARPNHRPVPFPPPRPIPPECHRGTDVADVMFQMSGLHSHCGLMKHGWSQMVSDMDNWGSESGAFCFVPRIHIR